MAIWRTLNRSLSASTSFRPKWKVPMTVRVWMIKPWRLSSKSWSLTMHSVLRTRSTDFLWACLDWPIQKKARRRVRRYASFKVWQRYRAWPQHRPIRIKLRRSPISQPMQSSEILQQKSLMKERRVSNSLRSSDQAQRYRLSISSQARLMTLTLQLLCLSSASTRTVHHMPLVNIMRLLWRPSRWPVCSISLRLCSLNRRNIRETSWLAQRTRSSSTLCHSLST